MAGRIEDVFADGGELLAAGLAVAWAVVVVRSAVVRRGAFLGGAPPIGVLTVLGIAMLLFGGQAVLADRIADDGLGATRVDAAVWSDVVGHRDAALTVAAEVLDVVGGTVVLAVLALAVAVLLVLRDRLVDAAVVASAPAVSALLISGFKLGYGRPRPPATERLVDVTGFSLPSGHALAATVVLGVLALVLARPLRRHAYRVALTVTAVLGVVAIGASRVYLGVHWATDVLVGWLLGGVWIALSAVALMLARGGSVTFRGGDRPT